MTVTSVADVTTKFLLGMSSCSDDSGASMDNFSLVLGTLSMNGNTHVIASVSGHGLIK